MADKDRVVYPDEVQDAKAKAAEAASSGAGDNNSVETPEKTTPTKPKIAMRNMIQVPPNCPEGYKMDENGVCREVW